MDFRSEMIRILIPRLVRLRGSCSQRQLLAFRSRDLNVNRNLMSRGDKERINPIGLFFYLKRFRRCPGQNNFSCERQDRFYLNRRSKRDMLNLFVHLPVHFKNDFRK